MDDLPPQAAAEPRQDISDDIEKDINIEVQITGNTGCTIEHHSQISINYYNLEHLQTEGEQASRPGVTAYLTHLPVAYVAALESLRAGRHWTREELAKAAYGALLKRSGIRVPSGAQSAAPRPPGQVTRRGVAPS